MFPCYVRFTEFIQQLQSMYDEHYRVNFTMLKRPDILYSEGKKFIKVITSGSQQSVYCFVDKITGDIYKAAGWNVPAKGIRGSIYNVDYDVGNGKPCDIHGAGLYKR